MARPIVLGPEADIANVGFPLVIKADGVAARLSGRLIPPNLRAYLRSASMRIIAAPLPWFFTGGSTAKPASRK